MSKLIGIKEIIGFKLGNITPLNGSNGARLGFSGMIAALSGIIETDGYEIVTDEATYRILIENGQSCCEDWGYFSSDDDFERYYGKSLVDVVLTDTALNQKKLEETLPYGLEYGGIQFVDFKFSDGSVLQFAVYNAHNGYYGHSIYVTKDQEIVKSDTL